MRQILVLFAISLSLSSAQSMLETGAVVAGTTVGGAAGKAVSGGIDKTFKKTGKALTAAAQPGDPEKERAENAKEAAEKKAAAAASTPALKVSAGVPKSEANNVPPPPPPPAKRVVAASRPAPKRSVGIPMVMSAVAPAGPPPVPVNVDLTGVSRGMSRDNVLALGTPSARILMYEDTHVVEIYQYRNQIFPSGVVRLRDGAVTAVEPRP